MREKLLPIVPGCKVIVLSIVNPLHPSEMKLVGSELTAVSSYVKANGKKYWNVDSELLRSIISPRGYVSASMPERRLMRIDGGSFEHEKHELEVKA